MHHEYSNWSGSMRFRPRQVVRPESEAELVEIMRRAYADGRALRVVGAGHSSSPLVATDDLLISPERLTGILWHDNARREALVGAGMRLKDLGQALHELGLALENYGDVNTQMIAGAISTGTHGSGKRLRNLETHVIGVRMVTVTGAIVEWDAQCQPDLVRAARVSLGTLGIFTALKLRLFATFQLHRRDYCTHIDTCLAHLDQLAEEHRNLDFYWYPRSDEVKIRTLHPPGEEPPPLSYARCVTDEVAWSHTIIPRERTLKFDEMEYLLPAEAGVACFQEVRRRIKERWRRIVGWRVLYRFIAADDALLSPAYERDSVAISIHQNNTLPYQDYFNDIEPIFRAYGGRPHWGKKHSLRATDLRRLYPAWDQFQQIRRMLDPEGCLLNPYLRDLLEDESPAGEGAVYARDRS
ncbi:D-arabinono-1,4-lactone oxidase [Kallotenue papyrolyticum]|uniref:D-arabinono-1,4-lactone oxidase n=1 Tax=Kallotenue papyrolyticum TaxID=1325125 RepID=UPI0004714790|nr:D-arabinono-1,4-lactone oxidase [Kallotenue papyrolyticum]